MISDITVWPEYNLGFGLVFILDPNIKKNSLHTVELCKWDGEVIKQDTQKLVSPPTAHSVTKPLSSP